MNERTDSLELGIIGNCSFGALVDRFGRINWSCMPRFDSNPVFSSLLAGGEATIGFYEVELLGCVEAHQRYRKNTAILETVLTAEDGSAIEIVDFAPRFRRLDRMFRPMTIVRRIVPRAGHPRIRIKLRPAHDWGAERPETTRGSNHIRYVMPNLILRCTTDAPVTYVLEENAFLLERPVTLLLGPDESLTQPLGDTVREFEERTEAYWQDWSRFLAIPFEWQDTVIRAAITLKLCSFDETGAIIAAMTTSIPEAPGSARNWDYRYCWLRDAYFVVQALNRLGATRTMENHVNYITNIVADMTLAPLQPVFGIALEHKLIEHEVPHLAGYRGMGPVRHGNQAYEHVQNDVYGSVIIASTQAFFDSRLARIGDEALFRRLERVGERCLELYDKPDAGLWEFRTFSKVHTYSSVMCWAGVDRLGRIADRLGLPDRARYWHDHAGRMRAHIFEEAFDQQRNTFVDAFRGSELDASLLLLNELGFVDAKDPRYVGTVDAVGAALLHDGHMYRYIGADDFGRPETSFVVCTFWYIEALAAIGRVEEARTLFERLLGERNALGLLSEDIIPETGELWGNFPQTYSMVGLVNCAMRLSKSWRDAF